jgi:hypothetical protein
MPWPLISVMCPTAAVDRSGQIVRPIYILDVIGLTDTKLDLGSKITLQSLVDLAILTSNTMEKY